MFTRKEAKDLTVNDLIVNSGDFGKVLNVPVPYTDGYVYFEVMAGGKVFDAGYPAKHAFEVYVHDFVREKTLKNLWENRLTKWNPLTMLA